VKTARWLVTLPLVVGCVIAGALVVPPISSAGPLPHAVVDWARASPGWLPSGGGLVQVTASVRDTGTCQLYLLSSQPLPVVFSSHPTTSCRSGHYSARVAIGANPGPGRRTVAFGLVVRNATSSFTGRFYVVLEAPAPPEVLSVSAWPSALPPGGGPVTVTGRVRHARSCQLELLSRQSFPVVYASNLRPCTSGFRAHVIVGPNPSGVHRTVAFALVARNKAAAFTGRFYVGLAPSPHPVATTVPPVPTTTAPTTTTTTRPAPVTTTTVPGPIAQQVISDNWSGYAVTGGPFTTAGGTFSVTSLEAGTPASDIMSEWVGIDGWSGTGGSQDLIQAGILESMVPCQGTVTNPNGGYNPNRFWVCAWTMFIENGTATQGPLPAITVDPGDSLTVEIRQQSGTDWAISMTDSTNGQSWAVGYQYYAGPGASAEWIVENPGTPGQGCGVVVDGWTGQCPMAAYSPSVAFSNLRSAPGKGATWYEIGLAQNNGEVSTPSVLRTKGPAVTGFTVSYTGVGQSVLQGVRPGTGQQATDLATPVAYKGATNSTVRSGRRHPAAVRQR
jgi:hypothetical protein